MLTGISPASSGPGQVVTLEGRGFFSPDGHITVMFGGRPAPVYCPTETTCHATVPGGPPGHPTTVLVVVETEAGASNSLSFTYSAVAAPTSTKGPRSRPAAPGPPAHP